MHLGIWIIRFWKNNKIPRFHEKSQKIFRKSRGKFGKFIRIYKNKNMKILERNELLNYLDDFLQIKQKNIKDYCPNGLQVEGKNFIKKIIVGVTACQDLLNLAVARRADAILVHHGYFWKGDKLQITGIQKKRLQTLLVNDVNLIAYHLPLDVHTQVGNNVQLAKILDLQILDAFGEYDLCLLGKLNNTNSTRNLKNFINDIKNKIHPNPIIVGDFNHFNFDDNFDEKIAWCSGAAQDFIELAAEQGAKIYISGEISERTTHLAKELGMIYIACGHHATERCGILALGEYLQNHFRQQNYDLTCEFIDVANPI